MGNWTCDTCGKKFEDDSEYEQINELCQDCRIIYKFDKKKQKYVNINTGIPQKYHFI